MRGVFCYHSQGSFVDCLLSDHDSSFVDTKMSGWLSLLICCGSKEFVKFLFVH